MRVSKKEVVMREMATPEQIIKEMEAYRVGQRVRVQELRDKLQVTCVELRKKGFLATVSVCMRLDALLQKKTQLIEGALLKFSVESKEKTLTAIGPITLITLVELVESIDRNIEIQTDIPLIAKKEGHYQMRMLRGYDVLLGNRALLEHMIATVERDLVCHATMDLVTRLYEVHAIVPQLPRGQKRKEIIHYRIALKNIGTFVRFVKKTHKVFCSVYPGQGM